MHKTLTVLLLIISAVLGFSQNSQKSNQPDLSGTWVLDMDRSDFGGPKSDLIYDSLTLIIEHREPEIKITRKLVKKRKETTHVLTYFADGRGEVNTFPYQNQTKSKTQWKDNKLIVKGSVAVPVPGDAVYFDSVDTWELTDGGRILVQKTITRTERPFGHSVPSNSDSDKDSTTQKIYRKAN